MREDWHPTASELRRSQLREIGGLAREAVDGLRMIPYLVYEVLLAPLVMVFPHQFGPVERFRPMHIRLLNPNEDEELHDQGTT